MKWTDLTVEERSSQKLRFNILAKLAEGGSISPEELDDILSQINALKLREQALESYVKFTVVLELNDTYANPVLTFDGDTISPSPDGKYRIDNVSTGTYYVEAQATGTQAFAQYMRFDIINKTATIELEPIEGPFILTINTTPAPSDAMQLRFDGRQQVASAGKYTISNVEPGQHQIDIDCTGYESYHKRVTVSPLNPTLNIVLSAEDDPFTVTTHVLPTGGVSPEVTLDGIHCTFSGGAYILENVLKGTHTLEVDKQHYYPYSEELEMDAYNCEFTVELTAIPTQDITINITPTEGATPTLKLDGEEVYGYGSVFNITGVDEGIHEIEVTKSGYKTDVRTIMVSSAQTSFEVELERQTRDITISVTPTEGPRPELKLDGVDIYSLGSTFNITDVEEGNHQVDVTKEGYLDYSDRIVVSESQTTFTVEMEEA